MYDWDSRSEMPTVDRDHSRREEPALQEYEWVRERRDERRVPIEIVNAILAELGEDDDED